MMNVILMKKPNTSIMPKVNTSYTMVKVNDERTVDSCIRWAKK